MTSERYGSPDDSPASSPSSAAHRLELEAAEALAVLAHTVTRQRADDLGGSQSGRNWGRKKKRRPKSESLESTLNASAHSLAADCVNGGSDLAPQDEGGVVESHEETKAAMADEFHRRSPNQHRSYNSLGGSKSRQILTEEEKERRRLRRILANRESARQTIRRRQALCEELTKRAADLTWENENLKRDKDFALKEFHALELANKRLKSEMSKVKVEESGNLRTICSDKYDPSAVVKGTQFCSLLGWSSHMQSGIVQVRNGVDSAANGKLDWFCHEDALKEGSKTPMYLFQGPWLIPVPSPGNGFFPPSAVLGATQDLPPGGSSHNDGPSSDGGAVLENLFPSAVKVEATSPQQERVINDLNEEPVGSEDWLLTSLALGPSINEASAKNDSSSMQENCAGNDYFVPATQTRNEFVRGNLRQSTFEVKQLVDAATAANARRKRKELTRLKNLHGRQCKTNC